MKSLSLTQPHALIMVGIPGSGKSHFADKFADTFHAPYIDHRYISERSANAKAADEILVHTTQQLMRTHASLIIETDSSSRTRRSELARLVRSAGYAPLFVWVQTDTETARQRFVKSNTGNNDEFNARIKSFSPPHESEKAIVISGKHTYATQAKIILKRLSVPRPATTSAPTVSIVPPSRPGRITIR